MGIDYHPEPERFIGRGTVWLAWDADERAYSGYWDLAPDGRAVAIEEAPRGASVTELLVWGRERAPRVFVRPESDPGAYYWAGNGPVPREAAPEGMKRLDGR